MATREAALAALQAKLAAAAAFGKVTRRPLAPEQMASPGHPGLALFVQGTDYDRTVLAAPARRTLKCLALVYVDAGANPNAVPDSLVNALVEKIEATLAPDNGATRLCTLGGLVHAVLIRGHAPRAPGDRTGKGIEVIPIDIVLP